jgi:hypothetical protein
MSLSNEETSRTEPEHEEPSILFFVKVFSNVEYAELFLDGQVYFNRLSYFKKIEDEESPARGDRYEGSMEWRQPADVKSYIVHLDGRDYELAPHLSAPLRAQRTFLNDVHVVCLYAARNEHLIDVEVEEGKLVGAKLPLPPELGRFGDHVVVIEYAPFIHRLASVLNIKSWNLIDGLVEYYDPDTHSGEFSADEAVLKKRKEFAYQSEYRIAFYDGTSDPQGRPVPVGSLRDIAYRLTHVSLLDGITLTLGKTVRT